MASDPLDYGSRVVALRDTLKALCSELHCEFSHTPPQAPSYDSASPHIFGRYPWYYELVSRGRALYVHNRHHFFCGVSLPWRDGVNQCLASRWVVLRPEVNGSVDHFVKFVTLLAARSGKSLVLKHVREELAIKLLGNGFRRYRGTEAWDALAPEDDQTCDEVIIDCEKTLLAKPKLQWSKTQATKLIGSIQLETVSQRQMEIPEKRRLYKEDVCRVFYDWLAKLRQRHPDAIDDAFVKWHVSAFETLVADDRLHLIFLRNSREEPVGVLSLARTGSNQADVVFSFIAEENGDFQRLAYRKVFEKAAALEFRYLNLGGSEVKSLFDFKKSLGVAVQMNARHLMFDV